MTTVVWRRFGKEHGEGEFRLNDCATVRRHLEAKVEKARRTPADRWPWYRVSDRLLIERKADSGNVTQAVLCYLPKRDCLLENRLGDGGDTREWYIHVGATEYHQDLSSWVFTDWFVDVALDPEGSRYRVADLDDLAEVHELGLVDDDLLHRILRSTQLLLHSLDDCFPPAELSELGGLLGSLGWLDGSSTSP